MKKADLTKVLGRLPGFRKKGAFYIGACGPDIVSGYVVDSPLADHYVWNFILPAYDALDFLHMSLGQRIFRVPTELGDGGAEQPVADLQAILDTDWQTLQNIRDPRALLAYLDGSSCVGVYAEWVRYLSHVRIADYGSAERLKDRLAADPSFPNSAFFRRFTAVSDAHEQGGWGGAQELLDDWSRQTLAKLSE